MATGERPPNLRFDLTSPCADCPFRHDVPLHDGIGADLPTLLSRIGNATVLHSCHKTDPRSDGFVSTYSGPVQHCAGLMVMLDRERCPSETMLVAEISGLLDRTKLNRGAPVYRISGIIRRYADHFRKMGESA